MRILVADEVGLGKTLVAKGIIAQLAKLKKLEAKGKENLFKVLYICSNADIALQNIHKLKIHENVTIEDTSDSRLSMLHLKIFKQENDKTVRDNYIQIIPMTPKTSFILNQSSGIARERALIFEILRRTSKFKDHSEQLEILLRNNATKFDVERNDLANIFEEFKKISFNSERVYPDYIVKIIDASNSEDLEDIVKSIKNIKRTDRKSISKLRSLFATISLDELDADLVILDEFQRFRELINPDADSDMALLKKKFFNNDNKNTKILLLSATPYKLYQTLEEVSETGSDEHYNEFFSVVNFLFNDNSCQVKFKTTWENFTASLYKFRYNQENFFKCKQNAESDLYSIMCRTERILVNRMGKFIDDKAVRIPIEISDVDIASFIEAVRINESKLIPVEYIKSCPYFLSFMMEEYKYKEIFRDRLNNLNFKISEHQKDMLFLNRESIRHYELLPQEQGNARLDYLKNLVFSDPSQLLLWVPPSLPYYKPQGKFENVENFSKFLVFSAWRMVPRMIACMISYECVRLTIGELYRKLPSSLKFGKEYFSSQCIEERNHEQFPGPRLNIDSKIGVKVLTVPSIELAKMYSPLEHMGSSYKFISESIKNKIKKKLNELNNFFELNITHSTSGALDWYWKAPLLFDLIVDGSPPDKTFFICDVLPDELVKYFSIKPETDLRDILKTDWPIDLEDILTDMAIASPAVCFLRVLNNDEFKLQNDKKRVYACEFARQVTCMFDSPSSIAAVTLSSPENGLPEYYKKVLKYCVDGNFAAMLDEYVHILGGKDPSRIFDTVCDAISINPADYLIDTYESLKEKDRTKRKNLQIPIRSHFAVAYYQTDDDATGRKERIRLAFNSPFRPFVLATTSIGQEGLDFHNYSRKIVHWNLPHNPIDIEQREGRINRYKSLAIRQGLAQKYHSRKFESDLWCELFLYAEHDKKENDPELIPFWCLPNDGGNNTVKIERFVPMYPYSKDQAQYERLMKILSFYRVTLGQASQQELIEYLFENTSFDENLIKNLCINLSPFSKKFHHGDVMLSHIS